MAQTGIYITILRESLERKLGYLSEILTLTKEQEQLTKSSDFDEDRFSEIIDRKDILIDNINETDKGFQSVYDRVCVELRENPKVFEQDVKKMQDLIRACTDKGLEIEALEERNRAALEQAIARGFKGMNQAKQSRSVANKYYQSMSNGNVNDSILYDRKK